MRACRGEPDARPAGPDRFFPELAPAASGSPPLMDQVIATSLRYGIVFATPEPGDGPECPGRLARRCN
ncbi:MAG: hypothetical protein GVY16_12105 [Planctomycetes bacterium]|jgi:hypothetical protein|nr:hypothetical protein [Planctomycetota bacterium]